MTIPQISVLPAFYHQLSSVVRRFSIDSCTSQAAKMIFHVAWVNDVVSLLPTFDSFANIWEEHPVLFIRRVKKSANVTLGSERRASKMNWLLASNHYLAS